MGLLSAVAWAACLQRKDTILQEVCAYRYKASCIIKPHVVAAVCWKDITGRVSDAGIAPSSLPPLGCLLRTGNELQGPRLALHYGCGLIS